MNPKPPKEPKPLPVLVGFVMVKKAGEWSAIATQSQGKEILRETVLATDSDFRTALDALDRGIWRAYADQEDLFE